MGACYSHLLSGEGGSEIVARGSDLWHVACYRNEQQWLGEREGKVCQSSCNQQMDRMTNP